VHSIQELAAMARSRLGGQQQGFAAPPQPGYVAEPQPGYAAEPQPGYAAQPQPGYAEQPGYGAQPGYAAQPQAGPPGGWQGRRPGIGGGGGDFGAGSLQDDLASAALGAAARFVGRKIGRRVQRAYEEKLAPAVAAKQDAMLREQIAIAERHPDLRACLTDHVVFLAGGSRALPMPNLATVTVAESDALVARLRDG
jgi:hypothetical protein